MLNSFCEIEKIRRILKKRSLKLHFVGILGAGMAPLAELCVRRGIFVSGSDREKSAAAEKLTALGIPIFIGHSDIPVRDANAVVYSLAIPESAPEIVYARAASIPLISRAELLGALMSEYTFRIGVSGSHGKSTTTALLSDIFARAGLDPTVVSGATLSSGEAFRQGGKNAFIYEACEYKNSFLTTLPTTSVILNCELDHTDFFKSEEELCRSFADFARLARDMSVINADDGSSREILNSGVCRAFSFGSSESADFRYEITERCGDTVDFKVSFKGKKLSDFRMHTLGDFVVHDATAAVAVAYKHGIRTEVIRSALEDFSGIGRRLELIGQLGTRAVFYDYAHHPTEISAVISAVKKKYGECTVLFRPHTYSRTASFWDGFVKALRLADFSVLVDLFPAREEPIPNISSEKLALAVGKSAAYLPFERAKEYIESSTKGAVILMGAGDIEKIKRDFLEK